MSSICQENSYLEYKFYLGTFVQYGIVYNPACVFTSFYISLIIFLPPTPRFFPLVHLSKLAFSQEWCVFSSQAATIHQRESSPCSERDSVVELPVNGFQINSTRNKVLLFTVMMHMVIALYSKYSVSFQEYEDRFFPLRHKHLNVHNSEGC